MQAGEAQAAAPGSAQSARTVLGRLMIAVFAVLRVAWFAVYLHSLRA